MKGNNRRRNFKGRSKNKGHNVNVNVTLPDVLTKQQVVDIVAQQTKGEKAAHLERPNAVIDAASMTWDEFDKELEWIEEKLESQKQKYPEEHETQRYVYTNAWDMQPIINYASAVYSVLTISSSDLVRYRGVDLVGFIGYVCALAETYVASNPEIVGVDGWTEASTNRMRAILMDQQIPETIGLMLLQLRPKVLECGTKVVLLPHTFNRGVNAPANTIPQVVPPQAQQRTNTCQLEQYHFFTKVRNQALGNIQQHANANHKRTSWMEVLSNLASRVQARYSPGNLNAAIGDGGNMFYQYYEACAITTTIFQAGNIPYRDQPWTIWFGYDIQGFCTRFVRRTYINFGNRSCYMSVRTKNVPILIQDAQGQITREPLSSTGRWVPWAICDTELHMEAFVDEIRAQQRVTIIHDSTMYERGFVAATVKLSRLKRLAQGHGNAMVTDPLA